MENNQEINNQEINNNLIHTYNCESCDYHTNIKMNWALHLITDKHKRNGQKKPIKCDKCDYIGKNHWNLKLHILSQHSTIEERKKSKYYCTSCDQVFFCKIYMERHNEGSKHKKNIIDI
jgi:hypothetical protein